MHIAGNEKIEAAVGRFEMIFGRQSGDRRGQETNNRTSPYSCRNASIGSSLDARNAGIIPLTRPTTPRIKVDTNKRAGSDQYADIAGLAILGKRAV